jgi:hypothetical protein
VIEFNLARRNWRPDPGLLLAVALAFIAALPFLTRPGLPRGTDAELHVFRAAELGYSLQAGIPYPRWAPDFYYGYGYPIFNYYAPLTYYLANFFQLWPGIDIVAGVKLVFVLGLVCAAAGTYLFVRDWIGPRPGLLAAGLYVFSPYVFFVDPHMRGVLAESFSLGLFPLALWALRRLLVDGRARWLALAAILQAALITSHNLMGVVLTVLLLAYLAWELGGRLIQRRRAGSRGPLLGRRRVWGRALLAVALGVGLSAIFWLPVALERGDVQLNVTGPGHFDFHNHFLKVRELLTPSPVLDLGAAAPHFAFNLGLPQWPLALLALPALIWGAPDKRPLIGFFALCAIVLVVLMLPLSTPIWEVVPGMFILQFPWRLLGPAGVMLSIAAAAGYGVLVQSLSRELAGVWQERWRAVAPGLGVLLTLVLALPAMFPPLWKADFGPTDPAAIIEFELTGVAVGTTSTGDYVPTTVEILPHPEPAYLTTYTAAGGVDKVNRATLPTGTLVETVSRGPTHDRFHVESSKPFILRLFTFYFPGWRATIDGQEAPIELGRPEGFITVQVPAGEHTIEVRLGALATPARAAGTLLSLFSLSALCLVGWWGRRLTNPRAEPTWPSYASAERERSTNGASTRLDRPAWLIAGGMMSLFVLFKVGLVDGQHGWFRCTSPPGEVLGAQHSLTDQKIDFGGYIQLLGYDLPQDEVRSDGTLPLTLYWWATAPVPDNYQVFAHLTRPTTHLWGQSDNLNPGEIPTRRWPLDKYVRDEHELDILPGTPPGEYQLTVGLYTLADGARVPVFDAQGTFLGDTFTLPTTLRVTRPGRPPRQEALGLTDVIGVGYADEITLLGAVLPDRKIELPGFVHLALLWRAEEESPDDITVRVQMVDAEGRLVDEIVTAPVDGRYPASMWASGEVVRDQYSFWLAETFSPGAYELRVGLSTTEGWVSLGRIEVVEP